MSIKLKTIAVLLSIFLIYGVIEYFIQRCVIFPSFLNIEKDEAMHNLKRSIAAIDREIFHLDRKCKDWTWWDNTYDFMISRSEQYVCSNLNFETFETSGFNAVFFCNTSGRTVWGRIVDLKTGKDIDIKELFPQASFEDHPLINPACNERPLSDNPVSGIIMTRKGPMMVASRPVLTSYGKGPSRGYAVFGQFLYDDLIGNLVRQTEVSFAIITDGKLIRSALQNALERLDERHAFSIDKGDKKQLHIQTVYRDIYKSPAFLIKTTIPRAIVQNGFKTIRFALISVFCAGAGIMFIIIRIMKRIIITPISQLTAHVLSLAEIQDYSMRTNLRKNDEIGTLAREIDRMVEKIEDQTAELISMNDNLINDISKRVEVENALKEANCKLDNLARIDGLTQIANRRHFDECIGLEWRRMMREKQPLSLIICDVDFFKMYNDTYGHQTGDECLKSIAQVIRSTARRPSDFPARYGGEEFAIILSNTDSKGAAYIAELIRKGVQELCIPHRTSPAGECVTLSLGISSVIPDESISELDLLDIADRALYDAKSKGRNCFVTRVPNEGITRN